MQAPGASAWRAAVVSLALTASTVARGGPTAADEAALGDAGARLSLQPESRSAGYDGKFFLASPTGDVRLELGALLQSRYTLNLRHAAKPDEDLTNGSDFRRAKLIMNGTLPAGASFFIQGMFLTSGGNLQLEYASATHTFENGAALTWGQLKLPFLHEEMVSESRQLTADRSIMNSVFTAGASQGVTLTYAADTWRVFGAVSDGGSASNTPYFAPTEADLALTGRAECRLGNAPWGAYGAFSSFRGAPTGAMLGAAIHWQTSGDTGNTLSFVGTPDAGADAVAYTLDASYEGGGWSLFGALAGRNTDAEGTPAFDDLGAILQAGVFVTERDELFARWDGVFPDEDRAAGDDFHTLTVGATHYFFPASHAAKLTADLQWYFEDQAGSGSLVRAPSSGSQILPDTQGDQLALRVQMQLLF